MPALLGSPPRTLSGCPGAGVRNRFCPRERKLVTYRLDFLGGRHLGACTAWQPAPNFVWLPDAGIRNRFCPRVRKLVTYRLAFLVGQAPWCLHCLAARHGRCPMLLPLFTDTSTSRSIPTHFSNTFRAFRRPANTSETSRETRRRKTHASGETSKCRKRTHFAVTECTRGRYRTILGSLLAMLLRRPARSTPELQLPRTRPSQIAESDDIPR